MEFNSKPWIILGLQKSVSVKKKKLLKNFINKKNPIRKEEFNYKNYRNSLLTLLKKSKHAYYDKFLKEVGIILRTHGKELNSLFL